MGTNDDALFFDLETHNAGKQWGMEPRAFVRLMQYAWGRDGEVVLTTDYDEMVDVVKSARLVIGHNIHSFDLSVLFGKDSTYPLEMAMNKRVLDTFTWASVVMPAPDVWEHYTGRTEYTVKDGKVDVGVAMKWLGLNQLNTTLGLSGKTEDLYELAKKYNPPKTPKKDIDYGLIPLDDPDFLAYAVQDVVAARQLATRLLNEPGGVSPYIWREQKFAAICAQNTRNGFYLDIDLATRRVAELAAKRDSILSMLIDKYGLPSEGKQPWRSAAGKAAIFAALADFGISPDLNPEWPKTATGNPSLGGKELISLTEGTDAEDLGSALAELGGMRPLAQQALDYLQPDGAVHPDISYLQRSGRLSTTKPGLTTWTARGPGAVEKSYFIARPGHKLVEFDYSNADARVVAAYSGDKEYIKRFDPDVDAHELTGRLVFGDETYDSDPARFRQISKMFTHAYSYGARANTLLRQALKQGADVDIATCQRFVEVMDTTYADVVRWQQTAAEQGKRGWITNDWGRRMRVSNGRSFTQSSALLGQSGTREILVDGLVRLAEKDLKYITWLKGQIHDAAVFEIPEEEVDKGAEVIVESLSTTWGPSHGGQRVDFTLSSGRPADDWFHAGH